MFITGEVQQPALLMDFSVYLEYLYWQFPKKRRNRTWEQLSKHRLKM